MTETKQKPEAQASGRGRVTPEKVEVVWTDDLLERAAGLIDQKYIDAGGDEREDNFGMIYWLDLDHLVEFEEQDRAIEKDKEFWAWFRDYRKSNKIWSKYDTEAKGKYKGSKKSYLGDHNYHQSDKKSYMQGWWSGWGYGSAGSELTRKLAIALGAVQSIVEVINDSGHRYVVSLATDDTKQAPNSVTQLGGDKVIVSPQALLDTSISQEKGIEVTSGWGLHEGSHIRHSTKVMDALTKPSVLEPLSIVGILFNIIEDLRIEALTSTEYPGFRSYFETAHQYLWDVSSAGIPDKWPPSLAEAIGVVVASAKWPEQYKPIVDRSKDPKLKEEYEWFADWGRRYVANKTDARGTLIEGLNRLKQDPDLRKQIEKLEQEERQNGSGQGASRLTDDQFQELMRRLKEMLKSGSPNAKMLEGGCPTPNGQTPIKLTDKQAQEIAKLLREELAQGEVKIKPDDPLGLVGGNRYGTWITTSLRPEETEHSKRQYVRPDGLVARMKSAFMFRKVAPEWSDRLQRTGALDEDMLWRLAGNDMRVFERKVITSQPETQVTLLVDFSSSMGGEKTAISQKLANTMLECLKVQRGVRVRVRGHHQSAAGPTVFRIWEPGDPMTRIGLIPTLIAGGTPDGHAIDWCVQELLANRKPNEDMVLFVISDGQPNISPNGVSGEQWVKQIVTEAERKGITTIQIAIQGGMNQAAMYTNWIAWTDENTVVRQLGQKLIKLFGGVS